MRVYAFENVCLMLCKPLDHDVVCTLHVEHELALGGPAHHTHALARAVEFVDVEDLVGLLLP